MKLRINGEDRDVVDGVTVALLYGLLDIEPKGTATELNGRVVPKSRHDETILKENDTVEIIRMTGGG